MNGLKEIKRRLYAHCMAYVAQRIENAQKAMQAARDAANTETKSSAGDKYETGRSMMQLESERYAVQLTEALKLKKGLDQVNAEKVYSSVQPGCLVITDQGNFFIAISAGKIMFDGVAYYAVSPASPVGMHLNNRKAGDTLIFNNKKLRIQEVI